MNRTQRFVLWGIICLLLSISFLALFLVSIFFFKWWMPLPARIAYMTILSFVFFGGLFLAAKKQSKKEVETDEMDISIQKVAAIISLISVLVVMGVLLIIANLVWGLDAAVPLWVLMLLFMALVIFGIIIFGVVILIQYGLGGKDAKE